MLPSTIVGSVVTAAGPQPFVLRVSTGAVSLGRYEAASRHQFGLAPDVLANIERQVKRQVSGAEQVRVGWFHCSRCGSWIELARQRGGWSGNSCGACSG